MTGSSSGIGEEIAKTLAREGVSVVIAGRNEERTSRVTEEIIRDGGKAFACPGDLSTEEGASQVVERVLAALGSVAILINNAGGAEDLKGWLDTSSEDWKKTFHSNVIAPVRLIRSLVPQMKELGWGRIIQTSSVTATQPLASGPDYSVAKAGIVNLTVSLAKELENTGITVNTVSPGPIHTEDWSVRGAPWHRNVVGAVSGLILRRGLCEKLSLTQQDASGTSKRSPH